MTILLSEISMSLGSAFIYYFVRIILFAAAAALGIFLGYRFKQKKSEKNVSTDSKEE